MMVVPARELIAPLLIAIGNALRLSVMIVMVVMHGIGREIANASVVMGEHEYRRMLDLIGRPGRKRRRMDCHQRKAERCNPSSKEGGNQIEHVTLCVLGAPASDNLTAGLNLVPSAVKSLPRFLHVKSG